MKKLTVIQPIKRWWLPVIGAAAVTSLMSMNPLSSAYATTTEVIALSTVTTDDADHHPDWMTDELFDQIGIEPNLEEWDESFEYELGDDGQFWIVGVQDDEVVYTEGPLYAEDFLTGDFVMQALPCGDDVDYYQTSSDPDDEIPSDDRMLPDGLLPEQPCDAEDDQSTSDEQADGEFELNIDEAESESDSSESFATPYIDDDGYGVLELNDEQHGHSDLDGVELHVTQGDDVVEYDFDVNHESGHTNDQLRTEEPVEIADCGEDITLQWVNTDGRGDDTDSLFTGTILREPCESSAVTTQPVTPEESDESEETSAAMDETDDSQETTEPTPTETAAEDTTESAAPTSDPTPTTTDEAVAPAPSTNADETSNDTASPDPSSDDSVATKHADGAQNAVSDQTKEVTQPETEQQKSNNQSNQTIGDAVTSQPQSSDNASAPAKLDKSAKEQSKPTLDASAGKPVIVAEATTPKPTDNATPLSTSDDEASPEAGLSENNSQNGNASEELVVTDAANEFGLLDILKMAALVIVGLAVLSIIGGLAWTYFKNRRGPASVTEIDELDDPTDEDLHAVNDYVPSDEHVATTDDDFMPETTHPSIDAFTQDVYKDNPSADGLYPLDTRAYERPRGHLTNPDTQPNDIVADNNQSDGDFLTDNK